MRSSFLGFKFLFGILRLRETVVVESSFLSGICRITSAKACDFAECLKTKRT